MVDSAQEQARITFVLELLYCLDQPEHNTHRLTNVAMKIDLICGLYVDDLVNTLLAGDERMWGKILSQVSRPARRYIKRFPRRGFSVDWSRGEVVDLYAGYKALSPFAGKALLFSPMEEGLAEACEEALHERSFCSDFDEFFFVVEPMGRAHTLRPVWLRAKPGSPGEKVRTTPVITV
jgi:hypothetical protein